MWVEREGMGSRDGWDPGSGRGTTARRKTSRKEREKKKKRRKIERKEVIIEYLAQKVTRLIERVWQRFCPR